MPILSINQFPKSFLTGLNDKIWDSMSTQQKKIGAVALAIFAVLAIYFIYRSYFKNKFQFSHGFVDKKNQTIVLTKSVDLKHQYIDPIKKALSYFPKGYFATYATYHWYETAYIFRDYDGKVYHIDIGDVDLNDPQLDPELRKQFEKIQTVKTTFQKVKIDDKDVHYQILK
jgi:hypothetical protein